MKVAPFVPLGNPLMVEEIKVGGVWFSLCVPIYVPIMGDFTEFEYLKSAFNLARLKKSPLVGL
ncbi:hypothetical protein QAD60_01495 [Helicobacter pylori]|nr:hypothetical protein [Helicobacter pylori]